MKIINEKTGTIQVFTNDQGDPLFEKSIYKFYQHIVLPHQFMIVLAELKNNCASPSHLIGIQPMRYIRKLIEN